MRAARNDGTRLAAAMTRIDTTDAPRKVRLSFGLTRDLWPRGTHERTDQVALLRKGPYSGINGQGADSFLAASSESLGPVQLFCRRRIRFRALFSVYGLGISLLLRIGWTCLIIAILEDDHLHPLTAELFCFCVAGHVDVDMVAVHLPTSVFHDIVAGIPASTINADAAV